MSTVCYELDKESKAMLMEMFPPKYPEAKYDHVTICMGDINAIPPKPAKKVEVVGIADDGNGIEVLIVNINGTPLRNDGKHWHITASYDSSKLAPASFDVFAKPGKEKEKPYKPVTSNGFLSQALDKNGHPKTTNNPNWKVKIFDKPIVIATHPKIQYNVIELQKMHEMRLG